MSYREKMSWYNKNLSKVVGFEPKSFWEFEKNTPFDKMIIDEVAKKTLSEDFESKKKSLTYHKSWGARTSFSKFNSEYARKVITFYSCKGDMVLDPFAGRTRKKVCELLGREYLGFEINEKYAPDGVIVDDCLNMAKYLEDIRFNLLFTCPPYWSMEKYSSLPGDLSNLKTYEEFLIQYKIRLGKSFSFIKESGLAVIVVADFRRDGKIISLHTDTINIARELGWKIYDIIIFEMNPAARNCYYAQAATKRRMLTTHEYCLVFSNKNPDIEIRKQKEDFDNISSGCSDKPERKKKDTLF